MTQEQAENYFNFTSYIWQSISGGISSVVIGRFVFTKLETKSFDNEKFTITMLIAPLSKFT